MTHDRNLNALWLRCILEEVLHSGAQDAILSPGGRAIALCLEIRNNPRFRHVIPHTDERSGSFIALGLARTTSRPVVIATTSGSAVANLVPMLTEAQALHIPLILLTCDRPRHLRNAGYGQMTDHIGACQAFVTANIDLPDPQPGEDAIIALRQQVSAMVAHVVNPELRGIVHINIPLAGLYDSTEVPVGWQPPVLSALALEGRKTEQGVALPMQPFQFDLPRYATIAEIGERLKLRPGLRGLIVAGPECPLSGDALDSFAKAVGFPVVADIASGLRRPQVAHAVNGFDALFHGSRVRAEKPELVIRLGLEPTMTVVQEYLLANPCPTIKITTRKVERDYLHPDFQLLVRPGRQELSALAELLAPGASDWLACWQKADADASSMRKKAITELPWGEVSAVDAICNDARFSVLHLSNSMAIRNADMLANRAGYAQQVFSNRGVNGIDGTIGSFLGELTGTGQCGLLLIGDQAFLHDLPGLAYCNIDAVRGCICVVNNGGGAIFDFLPASRLQGYQNTIRTISTINMQAAAQCFGLPYHVANNVDELNAALRHGAEDGGLHIIEIIVAPRSLVDQTVHLYGEMHRLLTAASSSE